MRAGTAALVVTVLLWSSPVSQAEDSAGRYVFESFAAADRLRLIGSARNHNGRLRLTPARAQQVGAAWTAEKVQVREGFDTTFDFQLTEQDGLGPGADGFALVFHDAGPDAIAGRGSAGGFALGDGRGDRRAHGIPMSVAVFFDTFYNMDGRDPSDNYIAICTNGKLRKMDWPPPRLASTRRLRVGLKDGRVHTARILYQPPVMSVYVDDPARPVLTAAVELAPITDERGYAYVGFTASTGNGWENHDILKWSFKATAVNSEISMVTSNISFHLSACLEGRNLCTPERALVEETGPGQYHVVLPAHRPWGASIPNADARPVAISDAQGMVCWDFEGLGQAGCGGPSGREAAGLGALVSPTDKPGALVSRSRNGRTYFSVNDSAGDYANNQGYFEFNVRISQ